MLVSGLLAKNSPGVFWACVGPGSTGITARIVSIGALNNVADIVVLMYHHVSPAGGAFTVSPEHFRAQMALLAASPYRVLSGSEFTAIRQGRQELGSPAVLITFDDGWLDNWVYALPVLREYSIPSVWFVVTGWPGEGRSRSGSDLARWEAPSHGEAMAMTAADSQRDIAVMRWSELMESRATGLVEIESHSHTHGAWWEEGDWSSIQAAFSEDLEQSRTALQSRMGIKSTHFCWPKGRFTRSLARLAAEKGFQIQHSVLRGGNAPSSEQLVRRINVEDRGVEWLRNRLRFYRNPIISRAAGWLHGVAQGQRQRQWLGNRAPAQESRSLGNVRLRA